MRDPFQARLCHLEHFLELLSHPSPCYFTICKIGAKMTVPPSSLAVAPKVKGEKEFEAGSPVPATQGALETYNGGYITGSRVSTLPRPRAHVFRKDSAVKSH